VWVHHDDARAAPCATDLIRGTDPVEVTSGITGCPVPWHTRGSALWHLDGHLLFSGDSLVWDPNR
jgi:glyoxylase-like metal-dependent hydrolase (beta-lactamase superfamily II)